MSKVYVKNSDDLIYEVEFDYFSVDFTTQMYKLTLIAGWDYIHPDFNDERGYVGPERFGVDVQSETIVFIPMSENLTECLADNDFTVIKELPKIYPALTDAEV